MRAQLAASSAQQLHSTESTGALERKSSKNRLMRRISPNSHERQGGSSICARDFSLQSLRHSAQRDIAAHAPQRGHVLARQLHQLPSDASASKVTSSSSGSYQTCYETPSAIGAANAAEANASSSRNGSNVISLEFPSRSLPQYQQGFPAPRQITPKPRPKSFARLTNQSRDSKQLPVQMQPRIVAAAGGRARARGRPSPQSSRLEMPDPGLKSSHSSNYSASTSSTSFMSSQSSVQTGGMASSQAPTHTDSWTSSMRSDRSEQRPIFLLGFDSDEDYSTYMQGDDGDQVRTHLLLLLVISFMRHICCDVILIGARSGDLHGAGSSNAEYSPLHQTRAS